MFFFLTSVLWQIYSSGEKKNVESNKELHPTYTNSLTEAIATMHHNLCNISILPIITSHHYGPFRTGGKECPREAKNSVPGEEFTQPRNPSSVKTLLLNLTP
uniref:Uncharacterized protein n=1 Tax=Sphaerodactylus townsendi TaxID=933632 RepID=A0ACB8F418_9SAUR